jgi:hypothetical protein
MFGIPAPSSVDIYRPWALLFAYKTIPVRCDGQSILVEIKRYRNADKGNDNAISVNNALMNVRGGEVARLCGGNGPFHEVFTAKGSPEAISTVLEFVYANREALLKINFNQRARCKELLGGSAALHPQTMMQKFCDEYIGLDCSGFVGNFIRRVKPTVGGPNSIISDLLKHHARGKRSTVDDVDALDVLIWDVPNHIAIVDSYQQVGNSWQFNIAQCTGPGPILEIGKRLRPQGNGRFVIEPPTINGVGGYPFAVDLGLW